MTEFYIEGICCELCSKEGTSACPVESASPWSRWVDFCGAFKSKKSNATIIQFMAKKLQGIEG